MAFSMKLKGGKKPAKATPSNALQQAHSLFTESEAEEVAPKLASSKRLPPPLIPMSRPGVLTKAEKAAQDALESDPNVFDYDGMYDSMQDERKKQKEAKKISGAPQSKYISALMEKAKIREIEHDRIRERRLLKEREEDDALHGDKEKFITASYKRKLMESKRWEQEDARLAAIEEANDVTKKEHGMANFYANLLSNNIAMGGDESKAISAYTTGKLQTTSIPDSVRSPKRQKISVNAINETIDIKESPSTDIQPQEETPQASIEDSTKESEGPPARSREDIIRAAKERYLARKQQSSES